MMDYKTYTSTVEAFILSMQDAPLLSQMDPLINVLISCIIYEIEYRILVWQS